jgi:uncharacterized protein (TIGR02453 family)
VAAASPFTSKTLAFLRALTRNNDREWFRAHAVEYESHVKAPMLLAIARIGEEFRVLAPELMADPKKSLYRIWRDTRFSADKRPLKTNVAAVFPHRLGTRHSSAGLYFEIAPKWVFAGGGIYMPEPGDLLKIRQRIASEPQKFHRLVSAERLQAIGGIQGERLTRVPRGFPADHPAAEYLRLKHYLGYREWPPDFATSANFWPELLATFAAVMPLVRYLNETIGVGERTTNSEQRTTSSERRTTSS